MAEGKDLDPIGDRRDLVQERDELRAECAALEAKVERLEALNRQWREYVWGHSLTLPEEKNG